MRRSAASVFASIGSAVSTPRPAVTLGRAVVLGGSVAGLLAARILAEHADRVVIIDRDDPGAAYGARPGVPQGTQVHALLPAGQIQLERWFPGFRDQAVASGAGIARAAARRVYVDGRRKVRGSDLDMLTASRPFLEDLMRRRTLALPNVEAIGGRVTGLDFSDGAVSAVHYQTAGGAGTQPADFVVDAMGRSSRLSDWLGQAGWDRPAMTRMTININYATATFPRRDGTPAADAVLALGSSKVSGDVAGAAYSAVEDGRWMVMLGGYGDSRPGHTAADFVRRCRQDFPPEFAEVVREEMLDDVRTYRQADSRRRDFHLLERFPARLVSVGDAVSSFNPIYGQGMSSAALHASCLSMYLRSVPDLRTAAREFFALQRVVVDAAWRLSTSADLARPSVHGPYPRGHRITSWVTNHVVEASVTDPTIGRRFDEVTQMLRHPSSLVSPKVLVRALRVNRRARRVVAAAGPSNQADL